MWVKQAETDDGVRSGTVSTEAARIAELEPENRELRRANQILKSAASFFASRQCHDLGVRWGSLVSSLPRLVAGGLS
jgi:transposase-like protein